MSMTSHDYNRISQALADTWADAEVLEQVAIAIADALDMNDNFDRAVFLAKAGVKI